MPRLKSTANCLSVSSVPVWPPRPPSAVPTDALRAGDQVDFGELGKFRLQISSKGAESAETFTSNHITGVNIQFVPGDDLKNIFQGMEFTPVPTRAAVRAVLKAQKAGETTVDITPPTSGNDENDDEDTGTTPGGQTGGTDEGDEGSFG